MLSVEGLSVGIRGVPILEDVSFGIGRGEVFGLVGESGSGKSMTALAVMGLLPASMQVQGAVRFGDQSLLELTERRMCGLRGRDIGMIFQEPMSALNPVQTIGDQVAETLLVHGVSSSSEAVARARERLDRVGLEHVALDRYPHELSGGQRQRVCIALAVALRPALLIADEPTTALDVTTQAQILDLLRGLVADEAMSLMLITHDLAVVSGMATRVAVMRKGRIVEAGATERLFREAGHPYTRKLFADSAHVPARVPGILPEPVLRVENVVRDYPARRLRLLGPRPLFRAVDDVSLTVRAGESVGLVGESGCGKSTLTRAILGLEAVQGGRVRLDGEPVVAGHVPGVLRAKMQVVFQDPYGSFNPRHRVGRLVAEPFHLLPKDAAETRARVEEALLAVGLEAGRPEQVHPRVLRRPAATDRDRAGHRDPAETGDPGRGRVGAGRNDPGADPRPAGRSAKAVRAELPLHQPRPERGAGDHRPGAGDEGRKDRRGRGDRDGVRESRARLHADTDRRHAADP